MLLLFETPAGFALFKVLDEGKLSKVEDLWKDFSSSDSARKVVELKAFSKFENTSEALEAATLLIDSKPSKGLRKFLRAHCDGEKLAVADSKLGNIIKEKLKIECVHDNAVMELMRGVRNQLTELISGLAVQDLAPMSLGLSHSLSRYKLKFSADKVDTMIIQAIGLLDDLDKELNTYAMRVREWFGWHFPELAKIVQDNILYAKTVKLMGNRVNAAKLDFSEILPDDVETELKEAAMISMGTEVSDIDLINIKELCDQVLSLSEYRAQLYDYLKSRMNTIAPNLTALVGELVGARLIAHGGSLLNLAKQPGSTVQILGAEKALFRALKTKHATPKYGLIYHASLIGQAAPKLKGKISRSLAAKTALAIRCDALGDNQDNSMGLENRAKLEARLRNLEGRELGHFAGSAKGKPKIEVYDKDRKKGTGALITAAKTYNTAADSVPGQSTSNSAQHQEEAIPKKNAAVTAEEAPETGKDKKEKKKRKKKADDEETALPDGNANAQEEDKKDKKKKKKKKKADDEDTAVPEGNANAREEEEELGRKKKKKHSAKNVQVQDVIEDVEQAEKKKKKRKHTEEEESETPIKKDKKKKKKKSED
ncbi:probable nucleolar protein 5-1 [Ziziphus jujuba]|uniref:Probable nucleolar protein 5-1 n=1 Tax=Ziziphus jujuba TaxID=326968 RepID=A0ABM3IB44_ZIZJJ|nr:probable nucleolar protein 5-1 [Ziziphus jujuba]